MREYFKIEMKSYFLFGLVFQLVTPTAVADETDAMSLLHHAAPSNDWGADTALKIDIDADGKPDYVFLSQDQNTATVGLVLGSKGNSISVKAFSIGGHQQNGLCEGPATIGAESLDYLPYDSVGAVP